MSEDGNSTKFCESISATSLTGIAPSASPVSVDRPGGKTYKSMLNEYCLGMKTVPQYKELPTKDEHCKEFRSQVTIFDKTFECVGTHPSKKKSSEMAAKEAMDYFICMLAKSLIFASVSGKKCVGSHNGSESKKKVEADASSVIATALKNEKISLIATESPGISTKSKWAENTSKALSR